MKHLKTKKFFLSAVTFIIITCLFIVNSIYVSAADNAADAEKKVIYLTFDDGPTKVTDKVLDTLKSNNVKATFFLIGSQIKDNEKTVKRIHDEGHSIGLHTYSHKNKIIYHSEDDFINEMNKSRDEVFRVAKVKPDIIRFPGGSRYHLNNEFLLRLHKDGYKVYDWNVVTSDGLNPKASSYKIYRQATKGKNKPNPVMLLLHCSYMHKNTCSALPSIIKYYKSRGYEFKVIDNNTKEIYFPIKNK